MNGPFSTLKSEQIKFLVEIAKHSIDYVVIGGYAMRFHGRDRQAEDLDLLIDYKLGNIENLAPVIMSYGTVDRDEIMDKLTKPNVYVPIDGIDVELFTGIKGVKFNTIKSQANEANIHGVKVLVMSETDLTKSKRASAREKDCEDIEFSEQRVVSDT